MPILVTAMENFKENGNNHKKCWCSDRVLIKRNKNFTIFHRSHFDNF